MKNNELKTVEIYATAFGGEGICRIDGAVCFVEGAFAGEKVEIEITERKRNFLRARAVEIIVPIDERIEGVCPLTFSCSNNKLWCPGCSYQCISYEKEIELKNVQFGDLLRKFAGINAEIRESPIYSPQSLFYRNKLKLHKRHGGFGFFGNDNKTIVEVPKCYIAHEEININLDSLPLCDEITLRYTKKDGVVIVDSDSSHLTEETLCGDFSVPASSFFQVNPYAHKLMLQAYLDLLHKISPDVLLDLYCGIGIFGIIASEQGIKSFGVEIDDKAVKMAEYNAKNHGVENLAAFVSGDVYSISSALIERSKNYKTCAVLDPPRSGLDKKFAGMLSQSNLADIIYISCSADTLCRDLKILQQGGYEIISTRMIDMFPRTKHFESITHLRKS
ncbi:MAG TPA: hypothetical protein DD381_08640 [Lentisphaeria bacterium]|nr:MAG: hypothetical protein A2X47_08205 [Lentisphaerae bacterium GWF2_38_69]HBM16390.1 hypothetical protein [Lentisphaeria bacterium]